jgi:RNA polymerase sigma-70 factor (ECF subfamily)
LFPDPDPSRLPNSPMSFGNGGGLHIVDLMTSTPDLDPRLAELGFEEHRTELRAYCYRMLGAAFEADDAVQETLVRAWKAYDKFEGRSSLRSWLYRIASNVCFDMLKGRQRRALPMDFGPVGSADGPPPEKLAENLWVGPMPDALVLPDDPADAAVERDSVRLAFVTALQLLPAKQRAVLILREVLKWKASEVAELLDTTVVSVNSALQRARQTLGDANLDSAPNMVDDDNEELLARYVSAFERFDMDELVTLLHDDVTMQMPPFALWLQGANEFRDWNLGYGYGCKGSVFRRVGSANGQPAFAQWRDGGATPWSIQLLTISDGKIAAFDYFVDPKLFPLFGAPLTLNAQ